MSYIVAGAALVQAGVGIYNSIQSNNAAETALAEAEKAREQLNERIQEYEQMDIVNPYEDMQNLMTNQYKGMENVYEDMTVNRQAAEFESQKAAQSQANIMQQMRTSAGGSGIAALAQSLANAGALQAQQAAVSIADQEQANQKLAMAEAARIQDAILGREGEIQAEDIRVRDLITEGEIMRQQGEFDRMQSLMALSAGDVANWQAMAAWAQAQGQASLEMGMEGAGNFAAAGADAGWW